MTKEVILRDVVYFCTTSCNNVLQAVVSLDEDATTVKVCSRMPRQKWMRKFAWMLFVYPTRGEGDLQYQYHAYCDPLLFKIGDEDADYGEYRRLLPLQDDGLDQCLATYGLKLHRATHTNSFDKELPIRCSPRTTLWSAIGRCHTPSSH